MKQQKRTTQRETFTKQCMRIEVFAREGADDLLYTCELDISTGRGSFWRGKRRLGSLQWDARRERFAGYVELAPFGDTDHEATGRLMDAFEAQLRERIVAMWCASIGKETDWAKSLMDHCRKRVLIGDAALHPKRRPALALVGDAAE